MFFENDLQKKSSNTVNLIRTPSSCSVKFYVTGQHFSHLSLLYLDTICAVLISTYIKWFIILHRLFMVVYIVFFVVIILIIIIIIISIISNDKLNETARVDHRRVCKMSTENSSTFSTVKYL